MTYLLSTCVLYNDRTPRPRFLSLLVFCVFEFIFSFGSLLRVLSQLASLSLSRQHSRTFPTSKSTATSIQTCNLSLPISPFSWLLLLALNRFLFNGSLVVVASMAGLVVTAFFFFLNPTKVGKQQQQQQQQQKDSSIQSIKAGQRVAICTLQLLLFCVLSGN